MHAASVVDGLQILVVDDNPDARALTSCVLEARGATVTTCASSAEAWDRLQVERFDVLVSDIAMPEEDGHRFLQRVRNVSTLLCLPAVALTAFDSATDREASFAAGFDAHVSKTAVPDHLLRAIGHALKRARKTSSTFPTPLVDGEPAWAATTQHGEE